MSTTNGAVEGQQGDSRQPPEWSQDKFKEFERFYTHADLPKRRDGKNLQLWKSIGRREISKEEWAAVVQAFQEGKKPPVLSGFVDGSGQEYSAPIEIWDTAGGIHVDFSPRTDGIQIPTAKCPVTGEPLLKRSTKKGHTYFQAKGFPGLALYEEIKGRMLSPDEVEKILTAALEEKEGPELIAKNKAGEPYPFSLKVIQNEKGRWEFQEVYPIKKTATQTICPVSNTPILESKNCMYSEAYPLLRFPKHYWGRDFSPEDMAEVVLAHHNAVEGPEYELMRRDGTTYRARISLNEAGSLLKLDYLAQRKAQTEVQAQSNAYSVGAIGEMPDVSLRSAGGRRLAGP